MSARNDSQAHRELGPAHWAALRNFAIGILTAGHRNIAAVARQHARNATRTVATLGLI